MDFGEAIDMACRRGLLSGSASRRPARASAQSHIANLRTASGRTAVRAFSLRRSSGG
jgi:hypothetical protein